MTANTEGNDLDGADPVIEISDLTTEIGGATIHAHLHLSVQKGETLGIVGGSGTGKSVLLRAMIGLQRIGKGRVRIFGRQLGRQAAAVRRRIERRWGVLFQNGALFSALTVAQNIQVPLREHLNLSKKLMNEIAALKLALVGLPPETGAKYPAQLSGGMRKRAGLARALAMDPEILFLDEPTAGLDPIGAAAFDELILQLSESLGLTVVMVTHDLDSLKTVCDRIAVLAEKQILAVGPLESIRRNPHPWIHDYFHGPRARAALAPT